MPEETKTGSANKDSATSSNKSAGAGSVAVLPIAVGIAALVVGLALGYAIWGTSPVHNTAVTTTIPLTTANSSSALQSTLPTTTSLQGGGAGQYYMSSAQAAALAGANGKYSATLVPGNTFSAHAPAGYNITGVYQVYYNTSTSISANVLNENVYLTNNSAIDYARILNSSATSLFNSTYLKANGGSNISMVRNDTVSGLKYSMVDFTYMQPTILGSNAVVHGIYLIGVKGDAVATISAGTVNSTVVMDSNALINTVAGDLPNSTS